MWRTSAGSRTEVRTNQILQQPGIDSHWLCIMTTNRLVTAPLHNSLEDCHRTVEGTAIKLGNWHLLLVHPSIACKSVLQRGVFLT